jgi:hypothetical protein
MKRLPSDDDTATLEAAAMAAEAWLEECGGTADPSELVAKLAELEGTCRPIIDLQWAAEQLAAQYALQYAQFDCVSGDTPVRMGDGGLREARLVRAGDVVFSPALGGPAEVVATLRALPAGGGARSASGKGADVVELPGGGWVTAAHPIRLAAAGQWVRPAELATAQAVAAMAAAAALSTTAAGPGGSSVGTAAAAGGVAAALPAAAGRQWQQVRLPRSDLCLCNFVLSAGHSLEAGGVEVAAMGHDAELGIHPPHAFYGVEKRVLRIMRALPSWPDVALPVESGSLLSAWRVQAHGGGLARARACCAGPVRQEEAARRLAATTPLSLSGHESGVAG